MNRTSVCTFSIASGCLEVQETGGGGKETVREEQCDPLCSLDSGLLELLGLNPGRKAEDLCYFS